MAGKKRYVVSVCETLFAIFKVRAVMLNRMDKRSHAWTRGKLIFAVSFYIYFQLFRESLSEKLVHATIPKGRVN